MARDPRKLFWVTKAFGTIWTPIKLRPVTSVVQPQLHATAGRGAAFSTGRQGALAATPIDRWSLRVLLPRTVEMTLTGAETEEEKKSLLGDCVRARAEALTTTGGESQLSNRERGPVVTGVMDPLTGVVFLELNRKAVPDDLHPVLRKRLDAHLERLADPAYLASLTEEERNKLERAGIPGSHSEVVALNEALHAREKATGKTATEADLSSFLLSNRCLIGTKKVAGIPPRCPHCAVITGDVVVGGGDEDGRGSL